MDMDDGERDMGWSVWGMQPLRDLKGSALEWSTIEEANGRAKSVRAKCCIFCGHAYVGGPTNIRQHLDKMLPNRNVRACKPKADWVVRHNEVVEELRARARKAMAEEKEEHKRQIAHSQGRAIAASSEEHALTIPSHPFQAVTADQVCEAWMKVIVKKALPLDLVNDRLFRQAIALTAKCGSKNLLIGADLRMPRRKFFTEKMLPALDDKLDSEVRQKVMSLAQTTGVTIISDGWTSVQSRPIINALASLPPRDGLVDAHAEHGVAKVRCFHSLGW